MMTDFASIKFLLLVFLFGSGNYHLVIAKNDPNCGLRGPETDVLARIINGEKALPHEYPWMGMLQLPDFYDGLVCGASLINKLWMVTAANCFFRMGNVSPRRPTVILGSNTPLNPQNETSRVIVTVAKWFPHPGYIEMPNIINDIALFKLEKEVDISGPAISPICIPEKDQSEAFVGRYCTATGWGWTSSDDLKISKDLLKVKLPIISRKQCTKMFHNNELYVPNKTNFCTWTKGKDTCTDDHGGPLNCRDNQRWYLTGVMSYSMTSWGLDCASPYPTVWANTSNYADWIWKTIADNS